MYRKAGFLIVLVLLAMAGPSVLAETQDCKWDETPVSCASTTWYDIARERGVKSFEQLEDEEITKFIDQRYVDGKVETKDWFDSSLLFDATCFQAGEEEDAGTRARLLMIALKAAEQTMAQNPDNIEIGLTASRMEPVDKWFCGIILRLIENPGTSFKYAAIRHYNTYNLRLALGQKKAAKAAIEDAYTLCPTDSIIRNAVIKLRTEMKDLAGAAEVVKDEDESPTSDMWAISAEATKAQRMGDIHLKEGKIDESRSELLKAWDALDRLQKKKEELRFVGVPIVDLSRNRCATSLGLIALTQGDIQEASRWLKASLTFDMFMEYKGYDMRLVKKAVSVPALKTECIDYLKAASVLGTDKMKDDAFAMLKALSPGITKKDLPDVSFEATVPKRLINIAAKCEDAKKSLSEGDLEKARKMLLDAWAKYQAIISDDKLASIAYKQGVASMRNHCATLLGLVAQEQGDLYKAVYWLRASTQDSEQGHPPKAYDLDLVEKLSWEPSLRADCTRYLELASKASEEQTRTRAKELLDKLKSK